MKSIETKEHVQAFLDSFLPKFDIWGIFFIDRKKNDEAMAALGITSAQRETIIRDIRTEDYIETIVDEMSFGDMWVSARTSPERNCTSRFLWAEPTARLSAYRFINRNSLTDTHSRRTDNDKRIC